MSGIRFMSAVLCFVLWGLPANAQSHRTIPFRITSRMWDAAAKRQIATPPSVVDKVQRAFALWSTVAEAGLSFRYDGLVDADYGGFHEVPHDGAITVVLNNWEMGQCADGLSQAWGDIPGNYQGGASAINTKKGMHTLNESILIHEIGHALGIHRHGASPSGIMSQADHPWSIQEYLTLSEQDRADLIRAWRPDSSGLWTISGRVETSLPEQKTDDNHMAVVFAVAVNNGHAYSAKTDAEGRFTISLLRPGDYRVLAKPFEPYLYHKPASQCPSWYLSDGKSTNDPYAGRVLRLSGGTRSREGLVIRILDRPVAFNFYRANVFYGRNEPFCFLRPGMKTRLNIEDSGMTSLEAYGSDPDYSFSDVALEPHWKKTTNATVMVRSGAEPGERLVLAKGRPGEAIQASLIGVNVANEVPVRLSGGSVKEIEDQVRGITEPAPASHKGSGRIISYKPGDPLPPELAPRPAPAAKRAADSAGIPSPRFSGLSRSYYEDGRIKREANYLNGRLNGPCKSYFPTGDLSSEGRYVDGRYEGILKTYFPGGAVRLEETYGNGRRIHVKEFDHSGKVIQESDGP